MPKVSGLRPHPAFDLSLLPRYKQQRAVARLMTTKGTIPTSYDGAGAGDDTDPRHYPWNYLNSIQPQPFAKTIDTFTDFIGFMALIGAVYGSWFLAMFNPLWLFDSEKLNLTAFWNHPDETLFLRRALLLEGLAWGHGLALMTLHHFRGILTNTDQLEIVQPMMGEFQSHRVHNLVFAQALEPSILTRLLLFGAQAVFLPLYVCTCLVYPPLCHATARLIASYAVEFYTDAIKKVGSGEWEMVAKMQSPNVACWFYGLPPRSPFWEVLLNIRADDAFHAQFNAVCVDTMCTGAVTAIDKYLDIGLEKH
jgi:ubiquinol oxidase